MSQALKARLRKISVMINSSGVREPSMTQVTGDKVLHQDFLQSYYATDNSCVWLSASLVINSVNPTEGRNMINQLQSAPHDYEWTAFLKLLMF